jgi:hypothetical protein
MKMLSFAILAVFAVAVLPFSSAEAARRGRRNNNVVYAAPVAASPAAAANVAPAAPANQNAVAQNQNQGYRSFSYQPGTAAPAMNYNSGYNRGYSGGTSAQSYWHNGGANKSMGRVNP